VATLYVLSISILVYLQTPDIRDCCVCVGEWSGHQRSHVGYIHWRQVALSLVVRQWRSCDGRWQWQSSHSAAE